MKKNLLLTLLSITVQSICIAQTFDTTWANNFQTVLDNSVSTTPFRGASATVFVPGQGMWTGVSGNSSIGVPITPDMRFGIASISKTFISVAMLKLQEQGVLSLDDHLYQWIPAYPNVDSTITIRQLLSNQSGVADIFRDNLSLLNDSVWADTSRFWTQQEVMANTTAPKFSPGHGYYYSNLNFILAAMVIDAATGISWVQNLHNLIFDPLDMDSTFVGTYETPNGPIAHEWINNNTLEIVNSPMTSLYSMMAAPGGIFTAPNEMVQFYNALLNGGILASSSFQELMDFETTSSYGLGLFTTQFGRPLIFSQGGMFGYSSICVYDPQTNSTLCIFTNGGTADIAAVFLPMLNVLTTEYPKQQNDAGIASIINPQQNSCNATVTPSVSLTNFGSSQLTAVTINCRIDGNSPAAFNWMGVLNTGASVTVVLPSVTVTNGFHEFTSYTSNPNGSNEGYNTNDTAKSEFIINILPSIAAPVIESFDGPDFPPSGWIRNSLSPLQWGPTSLASYSGASCAARGNSSDFINIGTAYDFDLPIIDLTGVVNPALYFKHAYTNYPGRNDSLRILISSDCGVTWQSIFYKGGNALRTIPAASYDYFYPADGSQWKSDTISLAAYSGEVLIRFRSINGHGNNLFIDDVSIDQSTVGIDVVAIDNTDINVYPNPAASQISIEGFALNSEIQISDITGKIVYKTAAAAPDNYREQKIKVNISDFSEGVYLVQIQTEKFIETKKVIIAR